MCCVLQSTYALLVHGNVTEALGPLHQLSLLIAALLHDYSHPGLDNALLVEAEAAVSRACNDQSVLENTSLRQGLRLLQRPGCNVRPIPPASSPRGALGGGRALGRPSRR